jgi:hypothetical protein
MARAGIVPGHCGASIHNITSVKVLAVQWLLALDGL